MTRKTKTGKKLEDFFSEPAITPTSNQKSLFNALSMLELEHDRKRGWHAFNYCFQSRMDGSERVAINAVIGENTPWQAINRAIEYQDHYGDYAVRWIENKTPIAELVTKGHIKKADISRAKHILKILNKNKCYITYGKG